MTGTEDSNSSTRPISVAELLAKNGTIGAPPVGGRRRRRRGNSDAVTVAELTGEIPIIRPDDPPPAPVTTPKPAPEAVEEPPTEAVAEPAEDAEESTEVEDSAEVVEADDEAVDEPTDEVTDKDATDTEVAAVPDTDTDETVDIEDTHDETAPQVTPVAAPVAEPSRPRRFGFPRFGRKSAPAAPAPVAETAVAATPVIETPTTDTPADGVADDLDEPPTDETAEIEQIEADDAIAGEPADTVADAPEDAPEDAPDEDLHAEDLEPTFDDEDPDERDGDELPSYLRSSEEPLFGGQSVVDELARQGGDRPAVADRDDTDADDELVDDQLDDEPRTMSPLVSALWIIGQSVIAVIFGAGLFVAFDQLWKWNNIVALVLSVLVILGLVVGVRLVRKTEDIGSTLIAVAVGALVTLGPLALLQSG